MTSEEHVQQARRLYGEFWSTGDLSVVDQLIDANYAGYDPAAPAPIRGVAAFKQAAQVYRAAFPDLTYAIEEAHAAGPDRVVVRWTAHGTHQGELMGIPPTGKRGSVSGMTLLRFEHGRVVEDHTNWDTLGLLQQIGAIPTP